MSIRIEINHQYVVTSDRYQFILQEKKVATAGKNKGSEWLDTVGYYLTIQKLISGLVLHDLLNGGADSFAALGEQVEQLGLQCQTAFCADGR
ncbi:DUF5405 family protein [Escherichia coli]|uniref:DUF5405 domain-containing protein n=1 Tax=Escherichia coli TaxID=562 RepID=A0A6D0ESH3_ECOLX|nr:DUF5405 family protein [Escherichia coli]EKT0164122.1 DUF5405 family protein [Escherichia coli]EMB3051990.1 DUF5405 family protein [Escherichia coli]MWL35374.1 hypothetical protein [Escherichia coli]MWL46015.1 hypothetical protein [Escherichia coli]MWM15274.1 hypothetical protein [Escherichia coli]